MCKVQAWLRFQSKHRIGTLRIYKDIEIVESKINNFGC